MKDFVFKFDNDTGAARIHGPRCRLSYDQPGFTTALVKADDLTHALAKFDATRRILKMPEIMNAEVCHCLTGSQYNAFVGPNRWEPPR